MRVSHSFSVELAELYGVECAILIQHFQFWLEQNKALNKNYHENRTWTYQTQREIASIYPYWSEDKVHRLINKLVEFGVLLKGNFNKTPFDRTVWYAFKDEAVFLVPRNRGMEASESRDPKLETAEPIPDTKTYTTQENNNNKDDVVVVSLKNELKKLKASDSTIKRFFQNYAIKLLTEAIDYIKSENEIGKLTNPIGLLTNILKDGFVPEKTACDKRPLQQIKAHELNKIIEQFDSKLAKINEDLIPLNRMTIVCNEGVQKISLTRTIQEVEKDLLDCRLYFSKIKDFEFLKKKGN